MGLIKGARRKIGLVMWASDVAGAKATIVSIFD